MIFYCSIIKYVCREKRLDTCKQKIAKLLKTVDIDDDLCINISHVKSRLHSIGKETKEIKHYDKKDESLLTLTKSLYENSKTKTIVQMGKMIRESKNKELIKRYNFIDKVKKINLSGEVEESKMHYYVLLKTLMVGIDAGSMYFMEPTISDQVHVNFSHLLSVILGRNDDPFYINYYAKYHNEWLEKNHRIAVIPMFLYGVIPSIQDPDIVKNIMNAGSKHEETVEQYRKRWDESKIEDLTKQEKNEMYSAVKALSEQKVSAENLDEVEDIITRTRNKKLLERYNRLEILDDTYTELIQRLEKLKTKSPRDELILKSNFRDETTVLVMFILG